MFGTTITRCHAKNVRDATEHNVLVREGVRDESFLPVPTGVVELVPFIPKPALRTFTPPADWKPEPVSNGWHGQMTRWRAEDHYFVDVIEFDG